MKFWLTSLMTAGMLVGLSPEIQAHPRHLHPRHMGHPGLYPGLYGYGASVYGISATAFYPPAYVAQPVFGPTSSFGGYGYGQGFGSWGGPYGGWGYPGFGYGNMSYQYSYYTHLPGMSLDYYRGPVPTYYPGPFGAPPFDPLGDYGGFGNYGYGPYGW